MAEMVDDSDSDLGEIMLAMDVVDTLRREEALIAKDLSAEARRENLLARLRRIYAGQGIDVPDEILMDGVMALENERFAYSPPKPGFGRSLASIYIKRKRWLPLFWIFIGVCFMGWAINYYGFVRPQEARQAQNELLLAETLPAELEAAYERAEALAATEALKTRAGTMYGQGQIAIDKKQVKQAEDWTARLEQYGDDLQAVYKVRIVSRPGEYSGVFRINDDGEAQVRNYYLIVEGIGPNGRPVTVPINSEEDQKARRTDIWGLRVPDDVFEKVAADKRDDQIIQNAVIGDKKSGFMTPDYQIKTTGGLILDW